MCDGIHPKASHLVQVFRSGALPPEAVPRCEGGGWAGQTFSLARSALAQNSLTQNGSPTILSHEAHAPKTAKLNMPL